MNEQERAAALADKIEMRGCVDLTSKWDWGQANADSIALIVSALRAYARPAPADLREAIAESIYSVSPWVYLDGNTVPWPDTRANYAYQETAFKAADAVLSILPQTRAESECGNDDVSSFEARANAAESILRAGEG